MHSACYNAAMALEPTIGLEIHAELKTATKMFCHSKNDANETRPNVNICPVCLAHPGVLPVINKEALKKVLSVGVAVGGRLADYTEFDRKNYFYPDLPKGYQLSQYEFPLVSGGLLDGVELTRIHLEEDTASSIHDSASSSNTEGDTLIDYNRSGVPLMELVTEPVIKSAEKAVSFARELQLLLRYLGVSDANLEKGEMRVEANVSVAEMGKLGTKVEIKNLNSFRSAERAIEFEINRQSREIQSGGNVVQETRGWDEKSQKTFSQRIKEVAADYRYFPDPDLPSLKISEFKEFHIDTLRLELPELPAARKDRYIAAGVKKDDAQQYVRDIPIASFFDEVIKVLSGDLKYIQLASNYIANDLVSMRRDTDDQDTQFKVKIPVSAGNFASLIKLVVDGRISSRAAKDILLEMYKRNVEPESYASEHGLFKLAADAIGPIVERILADNASVVSDYRNGKEAALKYLVGQGMKLSKGTADPTVLIELIKTKIASTPA